jgi:uncharacterized protein (UPF0261 family)
MANVIAIIGALDTKQEDIKFIKDKIQERGYQVLTIDTSVLGESTLRPDVLAADIVQAGGMSLQQLRKKADRGRAIEVMCQGIPLIVSKLYEEGKINAVLGIGGGAGTAIATTAMRSLPFGIPKVMISTLAGSSNAEYVGERDIIMVPSIVDIAGVNSISTKVYAQAVSAIIGMVETEIPQIQKKQTVAATMFGNTTPAVEHCKTVLEKRGYEVLVFHATGTGGRTMEMLVREGHINALLDITITELADELIGGVMSAGPDRLTTAGAMGIPQIIVPGCLDMVNFWSRDTVPDKFRNRRLYQWNPNVTLMRTTPQENSELGRIIAAKANEARGSVAIFLPLKGLSQLDAPGKEFWWPEANQALFSSIKQRLDSKVELYQIDGNINDKAFVNELVKKFFEFINTM